MNNIILIGFMGCGKTTVGIRLSYRLHRLLEDTDKLIEHQQNRSISDIFADCGEEAFRTMETECLKELLTQKGKRIISVGGGLAVREENQRLLKQLGTVVYLKASADTIYERLQSDTSRPLLQTADPKARIKELLLQREGAYEQACDITVEVDQLTLEEAADAVLKEVRKWKKAKKRERESRRAMKLLVINGPNLNFLGIRDKKVYGAQDYNALVEMIGKKGEETGCEIEVFQSNHEGAIIDRLQDAYFDKTEGIVINPGAFTHYSYAIRDALESLPVPKIEVHISDITNREDFRKVSVTAPVCDKQIYGQGLNGYLQAIDLLL